MQALIEGYQRVIEWNKKANSGECAKAFTPAWWTQVQLQSTLIEEEGIETAEAAALKEEVNILKESLDVAIVLFKQLDILSKAGYDVAGALEAVCSNNDGKIFDSYYKAVDEMEKLELQHTNMQYKIDTSMYDGLPWYTIKNMAGKVVKTVGFKSVDLTAFLPSK